jgi:hypothetical protein
MRANCLNRPAFLKTLVMTPFAVTRLGVLVVTLAISVVTLGLSAQVVHGVAKFIKAHAWTFVLGHDAPGTRPDEFFNWTDQFALVVATLSIIVLLPMCIDKTLRLMCSSLSVSR